MLKLIKILVFSAYIPPHCKVSATNFHFLKLLGTGAYGKVFLVRKKDGVDKDKLYAMKILQKKTIVQKKKTTEHTRTERQVSVIWNCLVDYLLK